MTARRAPSNPQDIAARRMHRAAMELAEARARDKDPSRWGDVAEPSHVANLERTGVEVGTDFRGRVVRAHRGDIWHQLANRDAITMDQLRAVRRLESDMAEEAGIGGHGEGGVVVDGGGGDYAGVTQRMMDAGKRVDAVLEMIGPPACRVLRAIVEEPLRTGEPADWRGAVHRHTGEARSEAQTAILRFAAQALADVYAVLDKNRRA